VEPNNKVMIVVPYTVVPVIAVIYENVGSGFQDTRNIVAQH